MVQSIQNNDSLLCYKREALEGDDLKLLVLLGEPLGYSGLVAVAELEFLIDEAVFLEELLHATLAMPSIIGIFN